MSARMGKKKSARAENAYRKSPQAAGQSAAERTGKLVLIVAVYALAVYGWLHCFLSVYGIEGMSVRANWTAAVCVLLFTLVYMNSRSRWLLGGVLLFAVGYVVFRRTALFASMLQLFETVLDAMHLELPPAWSMRLTLVGGEAAASGMALALQAVIVLVSLSTGFWIIRQSSVLGLMATTMLLVVPAPFFSLAPKTLPFFCLIASYLILFIFHTTATAPETTEQIGRKRRNAYTAEPGRSMTAQDRPALWLTALMAAPMIALCAWMSVLLLPSEGYQRPESVAYLRQDLLNMELWDTIYGSNDGLSNGGLRDLTAIRFTGDEVFRFRTDRQEPMYLRGFAGTVYDRDGWKGAPSAAYRRASEAFAETAPQNLRAAVFGAGSGDYTVSVEKVKGDASSVWLPYGLATPAEQIDGAAYVQDTALAATNGRRIRTYTAGAMEIDTRLHDIAITGSGDAAAVSDAYQEAANGALQTAGKGAYAETAQAYLTFVMEYDTALPQETLLAAQRILQENGVTLTTEGGALKVMQAVREVRALLTKRCSYSYDPAQIPRDADFTDYFLNVSQEGYCVHFATAATVLLRALGIPARYVEGYIITAQDYEKPLDENGFFPVEDTHAHAWTEIFDPTQLEWIPVEVTASADGTPLTDEAEDEAGTPTPSALPTPAPEETPDAQSEPTPTNTPDPASGLMEEDTTPTPEPTQDGALPNADEPDTNGEQDAPPEDAPTDGDAPDGTEAEPPQAENPPSETEDPPSQLLRGMLLILLLAALLTGLLAGGRLIIAAHGRKQLRQRSTNAAVLYLCVRCVQMLHTAGCARLTPQDSPASYALLVAKQLPQTDAQRVQRLMELGQRARFAKKPCTSAERSEAAACMRTVAASIRGQMKWPKRWYFIWRYPKL